jgi:hypothetical protein
MVNIHWPTFMNLRRVSELPGHIEHPRCSWMQHATSISTQFTVYESLVSALVQWRTVLDCKRAHAQARSDLA